MSVDIAIKVEDISKKYRIGLKESMHDSLSEKFTSILLYPYRMYKKIRALSDLNDEGLDIIYALKNVSFSVKRGEVLGIIGKNGAGKSTLLKILSKVTHPTSGSFFVYGRVASLLEVGTGFHPELTGRENVYLNGTILGMKKKEINLKFNEIVAFSGVEKYIDTPVKRYSSGMRVRLAFAVAAHLEPEILIIDEVLAVGDVEFQKKCLGKMNDIAEAGRTVLFVSHNMGSVIDLCDRALLLEKGKVIKSGTPIEMVSAYLRPDKNALNPVKNNIDENNAFGIEELCLKNKQGDYSNVFDLKDEIIVDVLLKANKKMEEFRLNLMLHKGSEKLFHTRFSDQHEIISFKPGKYKMSLNIPPLKLVADRYYITIVAAYMGGQGGPLLRETHENILSFDIEEKSFSTEYLGYAKKRGGKVVCPGTWVLLNE